MSAVLLEGDLAIELPADQHLVGVRVRDVASRMGDRHRGVRERNQADGADSSRAQLSAKSVPAFWCGGVIDDNLSRHVVPEIEPITWVDILCRKNGLQLAMTRSNSR